MLKSWHGLVPRFFTRAFHGGHAPCGAMLRQFTMHDALPRQGLRKIATHQENQA